MSRRLLLLTRTTGYQTGAFLEAARALELDVVLGSDRCHVLAELWNEPTIPLRFEDPDRAAEDVATATEAAPLDAVVAIGDETAPTAARVAMARGLPWHSPEAARAGIDKLYLRERQTAAALRCPPFFAVPLAEGAAAARRAQFPCVLKPLSLSASRGVIRADDARSFEAAFARIVALLESPEIRVARQPTADRILVEQFVPGRELAIEALVERGRLRVLAIFDKPDPLDGPFFEETLYVTPSRVSQAEQAAVVECLAHNLEALGHHHGPVHAEVRLGPDGPVLLEAAARPIGGLCARALRFEGDVSLEELVLRNALGTTTEGLAREASASGVLMVPVPAAGVLERVEGVEDAARVPGVWDVRISAVPGQALVPWPEGHAYPGFVFARGPTPEAVEESLREAHRRLRFVVARALARAQR